MTPDRLLELYNKFSDAPGAVERLRRFIFDLAVIGKLIDGHENFAPWSNARLHCDHDSQSMPSHWRLASMGEICTRIHYGYTASADKSIDSVRMVRITDIQGGRVDWESVPGCSISDSDLPKYALKNGDILIARTGGTIGKSFLVQSIDVLAVFASYLIRLQPGKLVEPKYLRIYCDSGLYWRQLYEGSKGTGQPNVNGQTLSKLVVPLPPLGEQDLIVAKVDELMGLSDELEAAEGQQRASRNQFRGALLATERFANNTAATIDNLDGVLLEPGDTYSLRTMISELAIHGALSDEEPHGPGSEEELLRISEIRRADPHLKPTRRSKCSLLSDDVHPFELPNSWTWVRISDIALFTQYGTSERAESGDVGLRVLAMGNIQNGRIVFRREKTLNNSQGMFDPLILNDGDLLYNRTNSAELVGKTGIFRDPGFPCTFASYLIRIRLASEITSPDYINLVMNTEWFRQTQVVPHIKKQTGQANVNGTLLNQMLIPLPPHSQQVKIVSMVKKLNDILDEMEIALGHKNEFKAHLLESALSAALNPSA